MRRRFGGLQTLAHGLQLLRRVEGVIGLARVQQPLDVHPVEVAAFRLPVGTLVAAYAHTLVERQAEPLERLYDIGFRARHKAVGVGVFDAQQKIAAMLLGEQVIEQSRAYPAYMQGAGGTRRKTYPHFSFHTSQKLS